LIGLGTNNSRLANILRNISWYYGHDSNFVNHYFLTKISQGLLHSAKGLVTAQFYYSDRFLLDKVSLSAILIFIIAISDIDFFIHSKYHFLIYFLALAIKPRYIITLDTE
jgi:26S proteasome regulatory subunit N1